MDAKTLAILLLLGHIVALMITVTVLGRQIKILRGRPDPELQTGRLILLALAVVIGLGNITPMAVDSTFILGDAARAQPSPIGIAYSLSNVLTLIFSSSAVLALYIIADKLVRNRAK